MWEKFKLWVKMIMSPLYEITVYRQSEVSGQMYKSQYTASRIFVQKEKHLKFRDFDTTKIVEIRKSSGLDYKIEEK